MDEFFKKKICDRCGKNLDVICMDCKEKETHHPRYNEACRRDIEEIKKGNYNFQGIGY